MVPYFQCILEISYSRNFLLRGSRKILPPHLQLQTLNYIHSERHGLTKRVKTSVWWIILSLQIEKLTKSGS